MYFLYRRIDIVFAVISLKVETMNTEFVYSKADVYRLHSKACLCAMSVVVRAV